MNKLLGRRVVLFALVVLFTVLGGCKKDAQDGGAAEPEIVSLVFNMGSLSNRNKAQREVVAFLPDYLDKKNLVAVFQLSPGAVAKVNGMVQKSSETPNDFSNPVTYEITTGSRTVSWTVRTESNTYSIGLGKVIEADRRLSRNYEWYLSQDTTGTYSASNGGPTCLAMALRWASQLQFTGVTATTVRQDIANAPESDGNTALPANMFSSFDIARYLSYMGVDWRLVTLSDRGSEIVDAINKGYLVMMNADMTYIPFNPFVNQHVNRYIERLPGYSGHYFLVKGYKKVDGNLFYEVYDPYNQGSRYSDNGEIKGRNRYYFSDAVRKAAYGVNGWKYAFVIHEKGLVNKFQGPVMNEVSPEETRRLLNPYNILYSYGF
jgi:hypothetical protein